MNKTLLLTLINIFFTNFIFSQFTPMPIANFTTQDGCQSDSIPFFNTSENAAIYIWDFGDGSPKSYKKNPKHKYNKLHFTTVTYAVKLIANYNSCYDTIVNTVTVYETDASFSFTNSNKTYNFDVTHKLSNSYFWDFGDGVTSTSKSPTHTYTDTLPLHNVCLETTHIVGCKEKICKQLNTVNILSNNIQSEFQFYPNPNNGSFHLDLLDRNQYNRIEISSLTSDILFESEITNNDNFYHLKINDGIYILKLYSNNGNVAIKKLIIHN
jgi:PKD repeat protein